MTKFYDSYIFVTGNLENWNFSSTICFVFMKFIPMDDSKRVRILMETNEDLPLKSLINWIIMAISQRRIRSNQFWPESFSVREVGQILYRNLNSHQMEFPLSRFWFFEAANETFSPPSQTEPAILIGGNRPRGRFKEFGVPVNRFAFDPTPREHIIERYVNCLIPQPKMKFYPDFRDDSVSVDSWEDFDLVYGAVDTRLYRNSWETINYLEQCKLKILRISPIDAYQFSKYLMKNVTEKDKFYAKAYVETLYGQFESYSNLDFYNLVESPWIAA